MELDYGIEFVQLLLIKIFVSCRPYIIEFICENELDMYATGVATPMKKRLNIYSK